MNYIDIGVSVASLIEALDFQKAFQIMRSPLGESHLALGIGRALHQKKMMRAAPGRLKHSQIQSLKIPWLGASRKRRTRDAHCLLTSRSGNASAHAEVDAPPPPPTYSASTDASAVIEESAAFLP